VYIRCFYVVPVLLYAGWFCIQRSVVTDVCVVPCVTVWICWCVMVFIHQQIHTVTQGTTQLSVTNFKVFCTVHLFSIRNEKPTDVTVSILFIYRRISTCFGPTGPSSGEFVQLFTQPLVQYPYRSGRVFCMLLPVLVTVLYCTVTKTRHNIQNTRPERYGYWTNGCVNSCVNSPENGPVGPKHVEIRRYMNKIQTVTSVGFPFLSQ